MYMYMYVCKNMILVPETDFMQICTLRSSTCIYIILTGYDGNESIIEVRT